MPKVQRWSEKEACKLWWTEMGRWERLVQAEDVEVGLGRGWVILDITEASSSARK